MLLAVGLHVLQIFSAVMLDLFVGNTVYDDVADILAKVTNKTLLSLPVNVNAVLLGDTRGGYVTCYLLA